MARPALEVADIFRDHGPAWRDANRGHVSLAALKVMSAIEDCRTAVLGGHVARCENTLCGFTSIAYNSCRNRHCPKCQEAQAREWMKARQADLLPVRVLSRLFRRLMLEKLSAAYAAGKLLFFGAHAALADAARFNALLTPLRKKRWFVYAKEPFAGPRQVLAYLSRYTHRVAISNSRLLKADGEAVTFRVKNYRANGLARTTTMTLDTAEFIRRFLLHVLPKGFHRIRHYGLLATGKRADAIERARELLGVKTPSDDAAASGNAGDTGLPPCPCCGSSLRIIETFLRGETPRYQPSPRPTVFRIDTS
ncbi:MAG: transposase [Hyphomicrobiaceae bacterium]